MTALTNLAHVAISATLQCGERALDATVGNGHDTLFLAQCVGPQGQVFGIDLQQTAIQATQSRLERAGLTHVTLILGSHGKLLDLLPSDVAGTLGAVMFNLGYLPGGDKSVITQPASTRTALLQALTLLRRHGVLTVLAYPGHPGGSDEAKLVAATLDELSTDFAVEQPVVDQNPTAPQLFIVRRLT